MKSARFALITLIMAALLGLSALADKERGKKLPVGSYITSAKIEILSGEPERVEVALGYLYDLFAYYGPHSEAYFWVSQIYVDYIEKAVNSANKLEYVKSFVAYSDSLRASCDNEDIKAKYRKDCGNFADKCDSIGVKYWREFYNGGVEKLNEISTTVEDMQADTDTSTQAYYREKLDALRDTAQAFFEMALVIDSAKAEPWMGLGSVLSQTGDLIGANEKLVRAMGFVNEEMRANLLIQVGNNYVNDGQYCEAIDYYREYADLPAGQTDIGNMTTLCAIYNHCELRDSSYSLYQRILALDAGNIDALMGIGRFFNTKALVTFDSTRHYNDLGDANSAKKWEDYRNEAFGEARKFYAQAYEAADDTVTSVANEYGLILILLQDYAAAIEPLERLTSLNPTDKDGWLNLGDSYLKLQNFDKCARAYEKVVEIEPDNRQLWEKLEALYVELKETDNLAKAREHLK